VNAKTTIRKVLFIGIWLCISTGMFILLLAAIGNKNKVKCSDYILNIRSAADKNFINKADIEKILFKKIGGKIIGMPVTGIRLQELELTLEKNQWIKNAELYFDNKDVLHVVVTEKNPVARIFTATGNSFYIDESGNSMPLSDQYTARVLVFTNFPDNKKLSGKDSLLLSDITSIANTVYHHLFWKSQIAQVDIINNNSFELIPEIGNNIVKLGKGEQIEQKLRRLYIFYQQVLSKTGFDKYKVIDVQYDGQVVASREDRSANIDPDQYRKNVEKLIEESNKTINTEIPEQPVVNGKYILQADAADTQQTDFIRKESGENRSEINDNQNTNPNPLKSSLTEKKQKNMEIKTKNTEKRIPKAVMPKKEDSRNEQVYN
jgi:cell division protein FtsQ